MLQHVRLCSLIAWALATLTVASILSAQDRIGDAVRTGEFAVALQEASTLSNAAERDEMRLKVAAAQRNAGARRPAELTLAQIEDDLIRQRGTLHQRDMDRGDSSPRGSLDRNGPPQVGAAGGGAQADFATLIELITTTVEPDTWEELGGSGAINGFAGGVYIDPAGLLQRRLTSPKPPLADRPDIPEGWLAVSLPRLEKSLQLCRASGRLPSDEMLTMGGLASVELVVAHPETGDVVIAGPATQDPAVDGLRLEDFIVVMHHAWHRQLPFGCSIDPRAENLATTQRFLNESSTTPLQPGRREQWVASVREKMGRQDIRVFGIDPDTTTAVAIVEADYLMKLIGLGLTPRIEGVPNYLELTTDPQAMDLVRWWFRVGFDGIETNADRTAFRFTGNPVELVSENELLARAGQRVRTGTTSDINRRFAAAFTENYDRVAAEYPVYARLRGIFQLATVAALIKDHGLAESVNWQPTLFTQIDHPAVGRARVPVDVETVVNHRVINGTQIILAASGGVTVDVRGTTSKLRAARSADFQAAAAATTPEEQRGPLETWSWFIAAQR